MSNNAGQVTRWPEVQLGDLLTRIEAGQNFTCDAKPPADNEIGIVKVSAVTWGEYDESETKTVTDPERVDPKLFVQQGDFLFSRANTIELVGACVIAHRVTKRIMLSDKILRFHFRGVEPAWVLYFLRSLRGRRQIEALATGNQESMRNIGQERIRSIALPLPAEQEQRVVLDEVEKQLSRVQAGVVALERVQANLKRYRTSVLKAACEGRLVPTEAELARRESRDYEPASVLLQRILKERREHWEAAELAKLKAKGRSPTDDRWKAKYDEPIRLTESSLPALPEGWCWASFDQLVVNHDGKRVPLKRADRAERRGEFPYYGASGQIDTIDEFLFDGAYLLIGEDGANLLSRSTPIAFQVHGKFWVNNHAHVVSPAGATPLGYLELLLNGMDLSPYVTGTAQPKLPQSSMNKIPLPLAPLREQQRVVLEVERRLSLAEGLREAVASNTARSDQLRKAILEFAFAGKLAGAALGNEPRVSTKAGTSSLERPSAQEGHATGL